MKVGVGVADGGAVPVGLAAGVRVRVAVHTAVGDGWGSGVPVGVAGGVNVEVGRMGAVSVGASVGSGGRVGDGVKVGSDLALRVARLLTAVSVACMSEGAPAGPQATSMAQIANHKKHL